MLLHPPHLFYRYISTRTWWIKITHVSEAGHRGSEEATLLKVTTPVKSSQSSLEEDRAI